MELLNVVRRLYHFGRSVSDLARACRLMGEGAYDRLHAALQDKVWVEDPDGNAWEVFVVKGDAASMGKASEVLGESKAPCCVPDLGKTSGETRGGCCG